MSQAGGELFGAALALRLSVAAVFWLCPIVHLQRLVFGTDKVSAARAVHRIAPRTSPGCH
jgi:hypothetical protein